jgi:serpin B
MVVSDVIHKAVIEVNEKGTKAVAVTMMSMRVKCSMGPQPPPPQVDFVADHPFAYFIVEEGTGTIVFASSTRPERSRTSPIQDFVLIWIWSIGVM